MGFNYFYGFLAGEASQYEPMLYENTLAVDFPKKEGYHLTEDMADRAITFMRYQRMSNPDKPFMVYFAPGAVHGPHQVAKKWADKYKGKFDQGWEELRKEIFKKQKEMGIVPENAVLTEVRRQLTHVNDIAPTIYDLLDITPPDYYNGVAQDTMDGISFANTFESADVKGKKTTQYFEVMGSRGIYKDGWFAGTFGPRIPWDPTASKLKGWDPEKDVWELYHVEKDFSQANDLAKENPEKLQLMKDAFLIEATKNKVFPIGGSLYIVAYHPEEMKASTLTEWNMYEGMTRIPEAQAPKFMSGFSTHATIEANMPKGANGVLFAVGGISAGFTVFMQEGVLKAEYNAMTLNRYKVNSGGKIPTGDVKIEVLVKAQDKKPLAPSEITLLVNGEVLGKVMAETTVPAIFTASESFDVGMDLGSAVALDYHEEIPFKFTGKIKKINIKYLK